MLHTPLCRTLGIRHPIISAPMGPDLTGPELVAAVSRAGGLGMLQAQLADPTQFRAQLAQIRASTNAPFGVNFIMHFPMEECFRVALEERVPLISLHWGDPLAWIERAKAAGVRVCYQTGSVRNARRAALHGADFIVAQGVEAGGHAEGEVSTLALVPRIADAIAPVPVVAAGGIADARGIVAALALGADAAMLGTRFLAAAETNIHPEYQRRLLEANEDDTVRTILFGHGWPNAPHRVLRTPFVDAWLAEEARAQEQRHDEPVIGSTCVAGREYALCRFMGFPPNREATGDVGAMAHAAGQSVGLVDRVQPAAQIVAQLAAEAEALVSRLAARARRPGVAA